MYQNAKSKEHYVSRWGKHIDELEMVKFCLPYGSVGYVAVETAIAQLKMAVELAAAGVFADESKNETL